MGRRTLDGKEIKLLKSRNIKDLFKSNFNKRIVIVLEDEVIYEVED